MTKCIAIALAIVAAFAGDALACGYSEVALAVQAACAIDASDSTVDCWGDGSGNNEQVAPSGTFTAIDGDGNSFCGVKTDGSLHCWGLSLGAATPSGTSWVDVELLLGAACGLKNDGDVDCWGTAAPTAPTNTMASISCLDGACCGIRTTGALECWLLGADSNNIIANTPSGTSWGGGSIDTWSAVSCARTSAGAVTCWGDPDYGEATVPAGTYSDVAVAWGDTCAVTDACELSCWGCSISGGGGDCTVETAPAGSSYAEIASGTNGFCAIDNGGNVSCFWSGLLNYNIAEDVPVTSCPTTACGGATAKPAIVFVVQ